MEKFTWGTMGKKRIKLIKRKMSINKYVLTVGSIILWNSLPREVVGATSLITYLIT